MLHTEYVRGPRLGRDTWWDCAADLCFCALDVKESKVSKYKGIDYAK